MSDSKLCVICSIPSQSRCQRCKAVWYCTKEHQQADWKRHKRECKSPVQKAVELDLLADIGEISKFDRTGATPLHRAAMRNDLAGVQILLECKADVNLKDKFGRTPLIVAIPSREVMQLLLDSRADVNQMGREGMPPLVHAVFQQQVDSARLLLSAGADVNVLCRPPSPSLTALIQAACTGNVELVDVLLEANAEVNAKCDGNALSFAAENGHEDCVAALIEAKGDVGDRNSHGATPLHLAALRGQIACMRLLIAAGSGLEDENDCYFRRQRPLHLASKDGFSECVALLLEHAADVNACDEDECTPLMLAAEHGHEPVLRALAARGADVDKPDNYGAPPVKFAAQNGHMACVRALVELGAKLNGRASMCGGSAVFMAAQGGHAQILEVLLCAGAEADNANKWGCMPLMAAANRGNEACVQLLLNARADPTSSMPDTSDTALLSAARYLRTRILDALITAGADVNAADSDGMTAIFLARRGLCNCAMQELREWGQSTDATELAARQEECVRVLLEAGADPLDQEHTRACCQRSPHEAGGPGDEEAECCGGPE